MNTEQIIAMQRRVGTAPDGHWGPNSIAACQRHLTKLMPRPHPFPDSSPSHRRRFFGEPGDLRQIVNADVSEMNVCYDGEKVSTIRAHRKVAEPLRAALWDIYTTEWNWVLTRYAGCYCNRLIRGGTIPSMHAYGAAIDFRPEKNGNRAHWPAEAEMPLEVMEIFARHGFLAAGAFWSRDAMHFEATRPIGWIP